MTILLRDDSLDLESCFQACAASLRAVAPRLHRRLYVAGEALRLDSSPVLLWIALAFETQGIDAKDFDGRRQRSDLARELEAAVNGTAESPLGRALHAAAARRGIELAPLKGVLEALDDELGVSVYETRREVEAHARRRTEPVADAVDALFGRPSERSRILARNLALGLQLGAWCCSFGADWSARRLTLPMEDLRAAGVGVTQLADDSAGPALRELLVREAAWARTWIARGWELCVEWSHVRGRVLAFHLRNELFRLAALERLGERALHESPRPSRLGSTFSLLASWGPRSTPRPLRDVHSSPM